MAQVVGRRGSPIYVVILLVFLVLIAALLAVVFYVQNSDNLKKLQQKEQELLALKKQRDKVQNEQIPALVQKITGRDVAWDQAVKEASDALTLQHAQPYANLGLIVAVKGLNDRIEANLKHIKSLEASIESQKRTLVQKDRILAELKKNHEAQMRKLQQELDRRDPQALLGKIHATVDALRTLAGNVAAQTDTSDAQALLYKIHRVIDNINDITAQLRRQVDVGDEQALLCKINDAVDNFRAAVVQIRRQTDPGDEQSMVAKLHSILDKLNDAAEVVRAWLGENEPRLTQAIRNLTDELLPKIHGLVDQLSLAVREGKEMIVLNRDKFQGMIDDFREMSAHLRMVADDVRRAPWKLLYRPGAEELAEQKLLDAVSAFAIAASELDDSLGRLQALQKVSDGKLVVPREQLLKSIEQLNQSMVKFKQAEKKLWHQLLEHSPSAPPKS